MSIRPSIKKIVAAAAVAAGVAEADILGPSVARRFARPRQRAYWLARRLRPDLSSPAIARQMSRLDHTTILFGCRQVEKRMASDPGERALCLRLLEALGGDMEGLPEIEETDERLLRAALAGRSVLECSRYAGIEPGEGQIRLRQLVRRLAVPAGCNVVAPVFRAEGAAA